MSVSLLLRELSRVTGAPDSIHRLRRFVLDLAVQGRLVPKDSESWTTTSLGAVCSQITDGTHKTPTYVSQGVPFISVKDFSGGHLDFSNTRYISAAEHAQLIQRCKPERGDVLLARIGTLGKPVVVDDDREFSLFVSVGLLKPDRSLIASEYLRLFLDSSLAHREFDRIKVGAGTHTNKLNLGDLKTIAIPLPPFPEQGRIIAKVDELMALCDQLRVALDEKDACTRALRAASLQRLVTCDRDGVRTREDVRFFLDRSPRFISRPEHVGLIRRAILELAVRGRLVPQNFGLNPQPSVRKDSEALPYGWTSIALGEMLAENSRNGYSRKPDEAADGIPILRISAGTVRTDLLVAEEEYKLIGQVSAHDRDQYSLRPGDLVACRFNGNRSFVGRLALFTGYLHQSPLYPDKLIRLRIRNDIAMATLIRWFAASSVIRSAISEVSATTVGNWGISATNLKTISFPLPPLAEQQRIVAKVDELMAVCDELEVALASAQTERGRLLETLLHDALNDGAREVATGESLARVAV